MDKGTQDKVALTFKLSIPLADALDVFVVTAKAGDRKARRRMTTRSAVVEAAISDYLKKHARERRG